mgnify:FL=1
MQAKIALRRGLVNFNTIGMAEFLIKQGASARRFSFERGGSLFFSGSLILFILTLAGLGGLILLNKTTADQRDRIAAQNREKEESVRPEELESVANLDRRLKNLRVLLDNHAFASNVFAVIEQNTHPEARFTTFNFSAESRKLDMSGETTSYSALSRQIAMFERAAQIERVEFGGLSAAEGKFVSFKISIIFKPTLLSIRP